MNETTETVDEMSLEQIEASFGPMTVFVSGTNAEDVQETFDHVWETMLDTSDKMKDMHDEDQSNHGGRTYG